MNLVKMRKHAAKGTPDKMVKILPREEWLDYAVYRDPDVRQFRRHMDIKHGTGGSIDIEIVDLIEYDQKKLILEYRKGTPIMATHFMHREDILRAFGLPPSGVANI